MAHTCTFINHSRADAVEPWPLAGVDHSQRSVSGKIAPPCFQEWEPSPNVHCVSSVDTKQAWTKHVTMQHYWSVTLLSTEAESGPLFLVF